MVLAGRADRVLLGLPGPGRPAAPRHLVDQLDLPHHRRPAVRVARQVGERLVAGDPVHGRVLAQPAPRRPDLRAARRAARTGRHLGAGDLGCFEKTGWVTTSAGRSRSGSTPSVATPRPDPGRAPDARCGAGALDLTCDDHVTESQAARHPCPDDRGGTPRAADHDRPRAVRREGLRGHLDRGDRGTRRGLEAGGLRALRRQGGPLRRGRGPRGPQPARHDARTP